MKNTRKVSGFAVIAAIALFALLITGCPATVEEDKDLTGDITISPSTGATTGTDLIATYDGSEEVTYQWNKNGTAIPDERSTSFVPSEAGSYTVTVSAEGFKSKTSTAVSVAAAPLTPFEIAPDLSLAPDDAKLTYTWTESVPVAATYDVYWKAGNGLTADVVKTTGTKITGATSGGAITDLTNGTAYSVLVTANKPGYTSINSAVKTGTPAAISLYTITGSGVAFTAKKGTTTVGTTGEIQNVINAIRTDANSTPVNIQFGDGNTVLDIGTASASFNTTGGTWGVVTLSGKITSANNSAGANAGGTVYFGNGVSVNSTADIANTNSDGYGVNNYGILNISGGTISASSGRAVSSNGSGKVIITGGTISANGSSGYAVYSGSSEMLTISGGTVSTIATSGRAVYLNSGAKATISGTAIITSNSTATNGTIYVSSLGGTGVTGDRLFIEGGTIENTNISGAAIYSNSTLGINISGGTVKATTGRAVNNNSTGKITVSGGLVTSANTTASQGTIYINSTAALEVSGGTIENTSTTTGNAIYNYSTGTVTISGGTITKAAGGGYAINNNSTGVVTVTSPPAVINGEQKLTQ